MLQEPARDQRIFCRLGIQIKESLQEDLCQQADTYGSDIYTLLTSDPPLVKEAWSSMKGWYQEANNYDPLPDQITIELIT